MDTDTKIKKYEQWLVTLKILTAACLVLTIVFGYLAFKGKIDPLLLILALLSTVMFFMAYREKSSAPRPGSPEYEAIERAQAAKIEAQKDRIYRKQHPFDVARELVENNKTSGSKSSGSASNISKTAEKKTTSATASNSGVEKDI